MDLYVLVAEIGSFVVQTWEQADGLPYCLVSEFDACRTATERNTTSSMTPSQNLDGGNDDGWGVATEGGNGRADGLISPAAILALSAAQESAQERPLGLQDP